MHNNILKIIWTLCFFVSFIGLVYAIGTAIESGEIRQMGVDFGRWFRFLLEDIMR